MNAPVPRPIRRSGEDRVEILDQTRLPHERRWLALQNLAAVSHAIRAMQVRGAPLIGVTAAYGLALALAKDASDTTLAAAFAELAATRPTAVNLHWALRRMRQHLQALPPEARHDAAWREADAIAGEDAAQNRAIGQHGLALLRQLAHPPARPLQLMTHCNAGWLATVEQGTALAPIYAAHAAGMATHVWVSETRPRNQGLLTAWELREAGVPHTVIADNAAGLLMLQGQVDAVITGADRVAANGDVVNKVGTFLKALAAAHRGIPFYVAAPGSTLDFACPEGADIPIEERDGDELRQVTGQDAEGHVRRLTQLAGAEAVCNPAFDLTPAALVTALITERGVCPASREGLLALYPAGRHG
ncbi:MAG: S-methyl-5-thioribose-1-phosphate isomerase [Zoogloeaceae bacterium]|jgi:methylthioribose-1-phosphate isomerase|nr:S-methyl-5-thioribose-1-phosphate isomerase [Zoogloeaceae bacterium]